MKKWLLILSFVLAGCASEQAMQSRHYLLPDNPAKPAAPQTSPILVVKTDLSEYLNHTGLVYRISEAEVVQAKHHLWAQGIVQQLTRRVINDLRAKQSSYWPVELNSALELDGKQQLHVRLQKFNGVFTGVAEIAGEWLLINQDGQIARNEYFQIEVPLKQEGYYSLIASLSEGLGKLTDLIAAQL